MVMNFWLMFTFDFVHIIHMVYGWYNINNNNILLQSTWNICCMPNKSIQMAWWNLMSVIKTCLLLFITGIYITATFCDQFTFKSGSRSVLSKGLYYTYYGQLKIGENEPTSICLNCRVPLGAHVSTGRTYKVHADSVMATVWNVGL